MRLSLTVAIASLLLGGVAQAAAPGPRRPAPPPASPACVALPKPRSGPLPFVAGEALTYDVDVMGAKAGQMSFEVLPAARGTAEFPVRVKAESNTFLNKMRRVSGEVVSTLRTRDLHPARFHEDLLEGTTTRVADVAFKDRQVDVSWTSNQPNRPAGTNHFTAGSDALDYVGAIYLFRAMPLKVGQPFCFEVYAIKRLWRVEGKVEAREHVSVPAGEFDAFHLSGVATSPTGMKREVHVWISDDAQRLPLAALGAIDLGPVRAQLVDIHRPDLKASASGKKAMEW